VWGDLATVQRVTRAHQVSLCAARQEAACAESSTPEWAAILHPYCQAASISQIIGAIDDLCLKGTPLSIAGCSLRGLSVYSADSDNCQPEAQATSVVGDTEVERSSCRIYDLHLQSSARARRSPEGTPTIAAFLAPTAPMLARFAGADRPGRRPVACESKKTGLPLRRPSVPGTAPPIAHKARLCALALDKLSPASSAVRRGCTPPACKPASSHLSLRTPLEVRRISKGMLVQVPVFDQLC
jgi:hypothetical protein